MLKTQIEEAVKEVAEVLKQAVWGVSDMTVKLTETTTRYRDTLARPAPTPGGAEPLLSQLRPKLRAREGV